MYLLSALPGFRDSVPVRKMLFCRYDRQNVSIKLSFQSKRCKRLQCADVKKLLRNVFHTICTYSNCVIYLLILRSSRVILLP